MSLGVQCACGYQASISEQFQGRELTCPRCQTKFRAEGANLTPEAPFPEDAILEDLRGPVPGAGLWADYYLSSAGVTLRLACALCRVTPPAPQAAEWVPAILLTTGFGCLLGLGLFELFLPHRIPYSQPLTPWFQAGAALMALTLVTALPIAIAVRPPTLVRTLLVSLVYVLITVPLIVLLVGLLIGLALLVFSAKMEG